MELLQLQSVEVLGHIFSYTSLSDWKRIRCVCSKFHKFIDGNGFELWKQYARHYYSIPLHYFNTIDGYKIMNRVQKIAAGITTWIGLGTQQYYIPYTMKLIISSNANGKVTGKCEWPSRGTTTVEGVLHKNQFYWNELKCIEGYITAPNFYMGTRFGSCGIFNWSTNGMIGMTFGVIQEVRDLPMVGYPKKYLEQREIWQGFIMNPVGTQVDILMKVESVENDFTRKVRIRTKNNIKLQSSNDEARAHLHQLLSSTRPTKREDRVISISLVTVDKLNRAKFNGVPKDRLQENSWLAWSTMDLICHEDMIVGYIKYASTSSTFVQPFCDYESAVCLRRVY